MRLKSLLIAPACLCALAAACRAQIPDEAKGPPAPATKPAPAGQESQPRLIATVGEAGITSGMIDKIVESLPANIPDERRKLVRQRILGEMIAAELVHAYLKTKNVACDEEQLKELKARIAAAAAEKKISAAELMARAGLTEEKLKDKIRLQKLTEATAGDEKVAAFVKANPSYFNGSKVKATHILIACNPTAPTAEQKAALAKIEKLAARIKAGKITFEKAADEHSACPSGKAKGGDLGEFAFGSMVPPFSMAAFDMKAGETSDAVRTQYGFHLIKVTGRTEGADKPAANAPRLAQAALLARLQNALLDQALTTCPIVIREQ